MQVRGLAILLSGCAVFFKNRRDKCGRQPFVSFEDKEPEHKRECSRNRRKYPGK
jgi:hypothetical protein